MTRRPTPSRAGKPTAMSLRCTASSPRGTPRAQPSLQDVARILDCDGIRNDTARSARGGTMKAVVLEDYGGIDQLQLREVPDPKPGAGEVVVKIAATSVNPIDYKLRSG